MLKITFLGTGSSGGIPRAGHTDMLCRQARKAKSLSHRFRSSALITSGRTNVLIDVGPDVLKQLKRAEVQKISGICLTHEHADATGGLPHLNRWLMKREITVPVFALKQTLKRAKIGRYHSMVAFPVAPLKRFRVGNFALTAFAVRHGIKHDVPTAGYRVNGFVYASDMDGASPKSLLVMRHASLLVLDSALWATRSLRGHFTVCEAIDFAKKLNPKRLLLTQLGHSFPPHEEAERQACLFAKLKNVPFKVGLAYDGLSVKV